MFNKPQAFNFVLDRSLIYSTFFKIHQPIAAKLKIKCPTRYKIQFYA